MDKSQVKGNNREALSRPEPYRSVVQRVQKVLQTLLRGKSARLVKCEQGSNALTFQLEGINEAFQPPARSVLARAVHVLQPSSSERSTFYLLDVEGSLVRFSLFQPEPGQDTLAQGAIYTGNDRQGAMVSALAQFDQLGQRLA